MLEQIVRFPGAGVGIHFPVFDYEVLRKHRTQTFDMIKKGVGNRSIELIKDGLIDHAGLITPLDDLRRQYQEWDKYIQDAFGIDTDWLFVWNNEMAHHPNMVKVWNEVKALGVILNPYHPVMKQYNFEPLELVGEDGSKTTLISSINDNTRLFDPHRGGHHTIEPGKVLETYIGIIRAGYQHAMAYGYRNPIVSFAHDISDFVPESFGRVLQLISEDPDLRLVSLRDYAQKFKPIRQIELDQGGWDTCFVWNKSGGGWFTQGPWHVNINGYSFRAHQEALKAEYVIGKMNADERMRMKEAWSAVLNSERSTARAHWSHPDPRKWALDNARKSYDTSHQIIESCGQDYVGEVITFRDKRDLARFMVNNAGDEPFSGLLECSVELPQHIKPETLALSDDSGEIPSQWVSVLPWDKPALLFSCNLKPGQKKVLYLRQGSTRQIPDKLAVDATKDRVRLENNQLRCSVDLHRGGMITELVEKYSGFNFLASGNGFLGRTFYEKEIQGFKYHDAWIDDSKTNAEVTRLIRGPLVCGVNLTTNFFNGLIERNTEYILEKESMSLRVRSRVNFKERFWFSKEWNECARFLFETPFDGAWLQWRVPGGPLKPKRTEPGWSGLETMGWVNLFSKGRGLALVNKLYPCGLRMVCFNGNVLGLSFGGQYPLFPYHKTTSNYRERSFEYMLVPNQGETSVEDIERYYWSLNAPLLILNDDNVPLRVALCDKNTFEYTDDDFSDRISIWQYLQKNAEFVSSVKDAGKQGK
jgi:hypothetical protein